MTASIETAKDEQNRSSQVLLAIRIAEDYLATDDRDHKIYEWREWIRNMPSAGRDIKIHGVYESFSTLVLLSVPTTVWTLLPKNPAYSFIGFITSDNILPSLDSSTSHELSLTVPEFSQTVETPDLPSHHNVQYPFPITVGHQKTGRPKMDPLQLEDKDPECQYPWLFGKFGFSSTSSLSSLELVHHPDLKFAVLEPGSVSDKSLPGWISKVRHTSKTNYKL
jgi:hypothetical protein